MAKIAKFSKFSLWKSSISCVEISFKLLPTPLKWSQRYSGKSGDSFRYLQSSFWMARSCCEAQKRILMKFKDFDQNLWKIPWFSCFFAEVLTYQVSRKFSTGVRDMFWVSKSCPPMRWTQRTSIHCHATNISEFK